MSKENAKKYLCVEELRYTEYYGMQGIFDDLYARSKSGEVFTDLMSIILMRENILLAYRNIKGNTGSKTAGTDKLTIEDIGRLTPDEVVNKVRFIVAGSKHGYRPKPVRRKDIPKPNGDTRPLGIPCIWDRLVQQCIKQVMEPICEAVFSDNSYGFRPNRSVENAIARTYQLMQRSNLHYVVEFDIKGFFDNVNHSKLIKQIWALRIHDKHLIYVLKQILKAPIKMQDGTILHPQRGTPQGGIISPLLANIVLNELDRWVESQWADNPVVYKYAHAVRKSGCEDKGTGYKAMRNTRLKEMHIVRYADDFRIFCRTKSEAQRIKIAVSQWLSDRLKLEVSPEKTRIVNAKRRYTEFLGFKIKVKSKGKKYVVRSQISDKQLVRKKQKLKAQAKRIAKPRKEFKEHGEVLLYNSMVLGTQNYYQIATHISVDCAVLYRAVMVILTNRLRTKNGTRLKKKGKPLSKFETKRYGASQMIRYVSSTGDPIYPIGYVQHKKPLNKRRDTNPYTPEGRKGLHDDLRINKFLMLTLMKEALYNRSAEYADNRISLFSAQMGKCAVTGVEFVLTSDIHCHHKVPKEKGGNDAYANLVLILKPVHKLVHAKDADTIERYKKVLALTPEQMERLNKLREIAGYAKIA